MIKRLLCNRTLIKASVIACGLLMAPHIPSAEAVGVFGFKAYAHQDLKPFPKWRKVLNTYKNRPGPCGNGQLNACAYQKWKELVDDLKDKPKKYQLGKVNAYINLYRYIMDPINWGVKDYWAIPKEFFAKFGDCEDYAIVKYFTLRALGWKADDMRIVILQDMNLRAAHAILIVNFEDQQMVLDNQIRLLISASRIRHYRPIYGLNEKGWWRYKQK